MNELQILDGEGRHTWGFPELGDFGNWDLEVYAHGVVDSVGHEAFKQVPHLPYERLLALELASLHVC